VGIPRFSVDVQILFDKGAVEFMGFICLRFLPGYVVETFLEAAFIGVKDD
jgi:hypothetical protein